MKEFGILAITYGLLLESTFAVSQPVDQSITANKGNEPILQHICDLKKSNVKEYAYKSTASVPGNITGIGNGKLVNVMLGLKGNYATSCLEKNKDHVLKKFTFNRFDFSQSGIEGAKPSIPKELTVYLEYSGYSKNKLVFQPDTPPIIRNILRDIIAKQHIIAESGKTQWVLNDEDIYGRYSAKIKLKKLSKDHRELVKDTIIYKKHLGSEIRPDVHIKKPTYMNYKLKDDHLVNATIKVSFDLSMRGTSAGSNITDLTLNTLSFHAITAANRQKNIEQFNVLATNEKNLDDFQGEYYAKQLQLKIEINELGNMTWDQVESLLFSAQRDDYTKAYLKLKAILRVHPESAVKAGELLNVLDWEQSQFGIVASALAEAGTAESQRALSTAVRDIDQTNKRTFLLGQSGLAKNPSMEFQQSINQYANDANSEVKQSARLALSNIAHTVKEQDINRYEALFSQARTELENSTNYEQTVNALNAIGNYGSEEALGWAEDYQQNQEAGIRSTALETLRFVDDTKAEKILLNALNNDAEDLVKNTAATELGFRELSSQSLNEVSEILEKPAGERVRTKLLTVLSKHVDSYPDAKKKIIHFSKNDPSKEVRLHAKSLLLKQ